MKAVVLAAGRGTRLQPLTTTRPKPILPVGGRPLLEHVLDACAPVVDSFVLVVGYRADEIVARIGDEYDGRPITYVEQPDPLGTAHAVAQAADHVYDDFLAINGDILFDTSLVRRVGRSDGAALADKRVDDPGSYGVVSRDGGVVTDIVEKPKDPPSNLANLGLYRLPPAVFEYIADLDVSPCGEYELTGAIGALVDDGTPVDVVEHDGTWLDLGRPWELLEANEHLLGDLQRHLDDVVEDGATIRGPVAIEADARVRAGTYVEGPTMIQRGADVGPNASIRGATVLGPHVRVGNAVEIKNAILMRETAVGHLSYVGDSVLGEDVNFGAGTTVANLRHDDENVRMRINGESVDSGRHKLGVVVGDGVRTGIDTSLNAGVALSPGVTTMPGETVFTDKALDDVE